MTSFTDIQKLVYKDTLECPRIPWYFTVFAIASVYSTYSKLKDSVYVALEEYRKTSRVGNFIGSKDHVATFSAVISAKDAFLSSVAELKEIYSRVDSLSFSEKYTAEASTSFAAAVKEHGKERYLANKRWGNVEEGTRLSFLDGNSYIQSWRSGPYQVPAETTYTKNGVPIVIPKSHSFVESTKKGTINVRGTFEFSVGGHSHSVLFIHADYTPDLIATLINLGVPDLASVKDQRVVLSSEEQIIISPTATAVSLGFPIGVCRSNTLFTDASEIAELFGGSLVVEEQEIDVVIEDGNMEHQEYDAAIVILKQHPFGVHLLDDSGAMHSYLAQEIINYQGPAIIRHEYVRIDGNVEISCDGEDVLRFAGASNTKTNKLSNAFSIRVFPGDVLSYWIDSVLIRTRVKTVSNVITTEDIIPESLTLWTLESYHRNTIKQVLEQAEALSILKSLELNSDNEHNLQKARQTLDAIYSLLLSSKIPKLCTKPDLRSSYTRQIITELAHLKCDVAIDYLKQGRIKEFLELTEISSSSRNIMRVYGESL